MISSTSFILLTGTIALIQMVFLPGWLILKLSKFEFPLVKRLIYSFGLSLMTNYWLIFILAAIKLYTFTTLIILIAIEVFIIIFLYKNKLSSAWKYSVSDAYSYFKDILLKSSISSNLWLKEQFSNTESENISNAIQKQQSADDAKAKNLFMLLFLTLAIITIFYLIYLFISNLGTVFNLWDPIFSWNRWAIDFSQNGLPFKTWEYPQLITSNWSISYTLIGMPIEFFSKAIMPLFPLSLVSILFYIGIKRKSLGFIASVPLTVLLMRMLNGSAIMATEGYVDTALTFFFFIAIISILESQYENITEKKIINIIIGAVFAIGAAMTKQGGLFITILYPVLVWLLVVKDDSMMKKELKLKSFFIYIVFAIILLGPFYISKELAITSDSETSIIPIITNQIYGGGVGYISQLTNSAIFIIKKCYGLIIIYIFLISFSLSNIKLRRIFMLVIIPYTIIWGIFLSYDSRNLSAILPLLGLLAGFGLENIFTSKNKYIETTTNINLKTKIVWVISILLTAFIIVNPFVSNKILRQYNFEKRQMFDTELSLLISNYFENHLLTGKIFTNSKIVYLLTATRDLIYVPSNDTAPALTENFNIYFKSYFEHINDPTIEYALIAGYTDQNIKNDVEKNIKNGKYSFIFIKDGYMLVKTNNK